MKTDEHRPPATAAYARRTPSHRASMVSVRQMSITPSTAARFDPSVVSTTRSSRATQKRSPASMTSTRPALFDAARRAALAIAR